MDIVKRLREGRTEGTDLRWQVTDIHLEAADEIERLRAIVRVNGLRWGHTHTEIDELLNQQSPTTGK